MPWTRLADILRAMDLTEDGLNNRSPHAKRAFADYLRANQTPAERMFARCLFHLGIDAEPQVVVRGWIVDFLDRTNSVIFEIDGPVHDERKAEDEFRDEVMTEAGYRVIRITNDGVKNLMANIAATRDVA